MPTLRACSRVLLSFALAACLTRSAFAEPADVAVPRRDENSQLGHRQLVEKARQGRIDLYFLGDSITRRWGATDYPEFLAHWKETFFGWNAGNFGWGGDTTQNILWRLENGELEGVHPKVIVLLAGTNNVGRTPTEGLVDDVPKGVAAIITTCQRLAPEAKIVLMAIFPRDDSPAAKAIIDGINARLSTLADGQKIRFLNINDRLADAQGHLKPELTVDKLHLSLKGYQVWGDALVPLLTELLGPRAATDHAPPPTGDPKALKQPAN